MTTTNFSITVSNTGLASAGLAAHGIYCGLTGRYVRCALEVGLAALIVRSSRRPVVTIHRA